MIRAMEGRSKRDWLKFTGVAGLAAIAVALATGVISPAFADDMTLDKGDNAWMMTSSLLVLMMTVPGLALFYGGLVRTKNMLSVLSQILMVQCIVCVVWFLWGYSLAFGPAATGPVAPFISSLDVAFMKGINADSVAATFTDGVGIPELTFVCFQMTFAAITTALAIGSFVERVKFGVVCLFSILWSTFVYFPVAHMVWAGGGFLFDLGALDFAGGTVVHINAGIAGLVGCLMAGRRVGYKVEPMPPHSLTMTLIGTGLLWVGWFGFNAGSNLEATGAASLAMANTFLATAAAGVSWVLIEWVFKGKPSLLGMCSGVIAGLVAVTPAAGFAGPMGALVLGLIVSPICFVMSTAVKNALGYDDSLDVFGIHCIGGIVGAIGTGILVDPNLGGIGVDGYTMAGQVMIQAKAVGTVIAWDLVGSFLIFLVLKIVFGLRVSEDKEQEGLDISEHGERAYHY